MMGSQDHRSSLSGFLQQGITDLFVWLASLRSFVPAYSEVRDVRGFVILALLLGRKVFLLAFSVLLWHMQGFPWIYHMEGRTSAWSRQGRTPARQLRQKLRSPSALPQCLDSEA